MMKFDNDIPPPLPRWRSGFTALVRKLKVGESVLVPELHYKVHTIAYRVLGKGNYRARKEHGGTRVWRLS